MADINCPYCNAEIEICHDDGFGYEEDMMHEYECGACEKRFVFYTYISFYYSVRKADCLNGAEHKYIKTHTCPPEFARLRCEMCGDEKPPDKEAIERYYEKLRQETVNNGNN